MNVKAIAIARLQKPTFLLGAERMVKRGKVDLAMDLIYDVVNELMGKDRFDQLNQTLRSVQPEHTSTDILLALLTSTFPARSRLDARPELYKLSEEAIRKRGEWEPGLLIGLEA